MNARSTKRSGQDAQVWLREHLPEWQQRLQQIKRPLAQVGVSELHLHLIAADLILQLATDQPPLWQSEPSEELAQYLRQPTKTMRDTRSGGVSRSADTATWVRLSPEADESGGVDMVLSLASRDPIWPAAPELAFRLWHAESHALQAPAREQLGLYRAQALAAANESEFTESLPALAQSRGLLASVSSRLPWMVSLALVLLACLAFVPVATPLKGEGRLQLQGVRAQTAESAGSVSQLMVGLGSWVQAGQPLYLLERTESAAAADTAYLNWAAQVRQRLLGDALSTDHDDLVQGLSSLRAAESARLQAVLAPVAGQVLVLPDLGLHVERGAAVSLVMPDKAKWQIAVSILANEAHLIRVGDRTLVQAADGRWLASEVTAVQPLAMSTLAAGSVSTGNRNSPPDQTMVQVLLAAPMALPAYVNQTVPVRIDAQRLPLYRQLLRRWRS